MSYNGRIPVPGFVSSVRKSTYLDRKEQQQRKQDEKDKLDKQQKQAIEIAKLLNQKWAEEDKKKDRKTTAESDAGGRRERLERRFKENSDDERSPRRGERRPRREDERESDDERRHRREDGRRRFRENDDGSHRDEVVKRFEEGAGEHRPVDRFPQAPLPEVPSEVSFLPRPPPLPLETGGWQPSEATGSANIPDFRLDAGIHQERKRKPAAPSAQFKGVFGQDDSDDEKEKSRQLAKKNAKTAQATPTFKPTASGASPCGPPAPSSGASLVAVQMKVAAWKQGLKGKAATMPEWLQNEVSAVMGFTGR